MPHISILSSSVRIGRNSSRVAEYFKNYLSQKNLTTVEILDLYTYNFPIFQEPFRFQKKPLAQVVEFTEKIIASDGIIIVTPEYNGGYPASLKNVIDLLYEEWHRKPIAISTVSTGAFGGSQAITSLQFSLWKIRAWTVPAVFPVANVQKAFDELGNPTDKATTDKLAEAFIKELFWCMDASKSMKQSLVTV